MRIIPLRARLGRGRWCIRRVIVVAVVAVGLLAGVCVVPAGATSAGSRWEVHVSSQPTYVSPIQGGNIVLLVTNRGAAASGSGSPVAITATLPEGLSASEAEGQAKPSAQPFPCEIAAGVVRCVWEEGAVASSNTQALVVDVKVTASVSSDTLPVGVVVSGGETPEASVTSDVTVSGGELPFGLASFGLSSIGVDGAADVQAGDHPSALSIYMDYNNVVDAVEGNLRTAEPVDGIVMGLPVGLVGSAQSTPKCQPRVIEIEDGVGCPAGSIIGTVAFSDEDVGFFLPEGDTVSPIYNVVPQKGYASEFIFAYLNNPAVIYGSLAHTGEGYVLRTTVAGVPTVAGFKAGLFTFFGDPGVQDARGTASDALFTNPVSCTGGGFAALSTTSWQEPLASPVEVQAAFPAMTGCGKLHFEPQIAATPEATQANTPTGLAFGLRVPQNEDPSGLASAELKNAVVSLPEGMSLSPPAADGLRGCPEEGPEGFGLYKEEKGTDTQMHLVAGHCPPASQIGTVRVVSPLVANPLVGHLYLAEPRCGGAGQPACTAASASDGELFGLDLEVADPVSGSVFKVTGQLVADPVTGRLTITFAEAPQLPYSELTITTASGPRATLVTPPVCGAFTTSSDLTPWSTPYTADAIPSSTFQLSAGTAGVGCGAAGWSPSFTAGSTSNGAGAFSPFAVTIARQDSEQGLGAVRVTTPRVCSRSSRARNAAANRRPARGRVAPTA
jgi:hypothetical protein